LYNGSTFQQGHPTLPLVYVMVIYNGKPSPYPHTRDLFDLFDNREAAKEWFFKTLHLIDLHQLSDGQIKQFGFAAIMALVMRYIRTGDIKNAIELLIKWDAFEQAQAFGLADFIAAMVKYMSARQTTG
jgi:hypothetical protein